MLPPSPALELMTVEAKDEVVTYDERVIHRGLDMAKMLQIVELHQMPRSFSRTQVIGGCQSITKQISS